MIREKKIVLIRRLIGLVLILFGLIFTLVDAVYTPKLDNCEVYTEYNQSTNTTHYQIEAVFSTNVENAKITINFYDANEKFIGKTTRTANPWYETDKVTFDDDSFYDTFSISGEIVSFEIVDYDATADLRIIGTEPITFTLLTAIFVILLPILTCKCKTYYYDGKKIVVYVGYFNHYLMIDGEKADERKTLESWVPIYLTSESDEMSVEITISTCNFVTTKINGKLARPASFFEKEIKNGDINVE